MPGSAHSVRMAAACEASIEQVTVSKSRKRMVFACSCEPSTRIRVLVYLSINLYNYNVTNSCRSVIVTECSLIVTDGDWFTDNEARARPPLMINEQQDGDGWAMLT